MEFHDDMSCSTYIPLPLYFFLMLILRNTRYLVMSKPYLEKSLENPEPVSDLLRMLRLFVSTSLMKIHMRPPPVNRYLLRNTDDIDQLAIEEKKREGKEQLPSSCEHIFIYFDHHWFFILLQIFKNIQTQLNLLVQIECWSTKERDTSHPILKKCQHKVCFSKLWINSFH